MRRCWCFFAKIECRNLPFFREDNHEPAASDVAGRRMHNGKGKPRRNGGVDGVSPFLQNLHADLRCKTMRRNNHSLLRSDRVPRLRLCDADSDEEKKSDEREVMEKPGFHDRSFMSHVDCTERIYENVQT